MVGKYTFAWSGNRRIMWCLVWILGCMVLLPTLSFSQKYLEGRWEGTLNDYDSSGVRVSYKMELFLEIEGNELSGRCFVHLAPGKVVAMEVFGYQYGDLSVGLRDQEYLGQDQEAGPPYFRKYQLLPYRTLWESTLNGYWQQITNIDPLDKRRRLGTIQLKKVDNGKA